MKKRPEKKSSSKPSNTPPEYKNLGKLKKSSGDDTVRLNKFIADAGVCSRRDADELIKKGVIKLNGKTVTEMGVRVSANDEVFYKGKKLQKERFVYILLNKPKDYITTTEDPQERKTVMSLVKEACNERIFPVGRLDRQTTGLLLFTNDGQLAKKLTHPSHNIRKLYEATLNKPLEEEHFLKIKEGFELEDGAVTVDDIALSVEGDHIIGLEIHIGRNRIVRRIFEHFGYEVVKLDRVVYAGLTKKNLARGQWRYIGEKELVRLLNYK